MRKLFLSLLRNKGIIMSIEHSRSLQPEAGWGPQSPQRCGQPGGAALSPSVPKPAEPEPWAQALPSGSPCSRSLSPVRPTLAHGGVGTDQDNLTNTGESRPLTLQMKTAFRGEKVGFSWGGG